MFELASDTHHARIRHCISSSDARFVLNSRETSSRPSRTLSYGAVGGGSRFGTAMLQEAACRLMTTDAPENPPRCHGGMNDSFTCVASCFSVLTEDVVVHVVSSSSAFPYATQEAVEGL